MSAFEMKADIELLEASQTNLAARHQSRFAADFLAMSGNLFFSDCQDTVRQTGGRALDLFL